ncbi:MAG: GAF domain-containing protein [Syntrophothermus sp.]
MSGTILIDSKLDEAEKYSLLAEQLEHLLDVSDPNLSKLANFTAAVKQVFDKVSWAGFYLADGDSLYLGPFQGKIACTRIKIGNGVCGTAAAEKRIVTVPDVDKFPGHIACDADSRSEIVLPLIKDGTLYGVLDLDSTSLNSFGPVDEKYLADLCAILLRKLS